MQILDISSSNITIVEEEMEKLNGQAMLLRAMKINTEKDQKVTEPLWMIEEIKQNMKERKRRNRMTRSTGNEDEKAELEKNYLQQIYEVQQLIKTAMEKYEQKVTEEIRQEKEQKALGIY